MKFGSNSLMSLCPQTENKHCIAIEALLKLV